MARRKQVKFWRKPDFSVMLTEAQLWELYHQAPPEEQAQVALMGRWWYGILKNSDGPDGRREPAGK